MPGHGQKPKQNDFKRVFGLTGNIACGKSTVAEILKASGHEVIDADQIAREAVLPGSPTLGEMTARFGNEILAADGSLDRAKMRAMVFSSPEIKAGIEAILHPAIVERSGELIAMALSRSAAKPDSLVFYDAALIVETGRYKDFGGLVVVVCDENIQKERLKTRDQLTDEMAAQIIGAQMPQSEKAKKADWVIDNSGAKSELQAKVAKAVQDIRSRR